MGIADASAAQADGAGGRAAVAGRGHGAARGRPASLGAARRLCANQAGLGDALTELRPTVALFLRFTGIDFAGDPYAGEQLDTFIRAVQGVLVRYEGALLELTIGDKGSYLYAVFGAPVAHEDDAHRAVRAAAALQALPDSLDFLQAVQIGLSRGVMRTGAYGGSTRRIYGVEGDEVNLAARLMQRATPGEVLLSGRVQTALGDAFVLEPLAPLPLKGLPEPLPVFRLAGQRTAAVHLSEPAYALPMVGRAAELALVEEKLALALGEQGQVVGITAEAGLGKSRLLAEVLRLARRRGLRAFGGACQSYGTNTPYLVWGPVWRSFFDVNPEAPPRRQVRALAGRGGRPGPRPRGGAAPARVPAGPAPAGERVHAVRWSRSTARAPWRRCCWTACAAAAREAQEEGSGLLFVLEDLHWIDPTSHDLLELLAKESATLPVLFVLAYRPPELLRLQPPRVEALPHFTRLTLAPLTGEETAQVVRSKLAQLLPDRRGLVTPTLIERIMARAEGNPFYVEELLNYLHDRGIDPTDLAALEVLELPASLHSLILSRIDQLTTGQQITLKVASVIGRLVRFAWLHGAYPDLGPAPLLREDLDELSRLELTPLDTPEPELTYLFKHVVTQEVAYENLAQATRATLHEQLAAYLEGRAGKDAAADVDLLAYHYERSANAAKAGTYLRQAGEAAAARYANAAAVDYLTRALALTPNGKPAERYGLLRAREQVYDLQGERTAQQQDVEDLTHLAEMLGGAGERVEAAVRRAAYEERVSHFPAAIAAAEQAVALARGAGLAAAEATAQFQLGWVLWRRNTVAEARAPLVRSLTLARALGDRWLESRVLGSLGVVADLEGNNAHAHAYYDQSVQAARASGNRQQESYTLHDHGVLMTHEGDFGCARAHLTESLSISRAIGEHVIEAMACRGLAWCAWISGDYAGAGSYLEQGVAIARALGDQRLEGYVLRWRGWIALCAGAYATCHAAYEQALALARATGDQRGENNVWANLGTLRRNEGDAVGARAAYEQALAGARASGDQPAEGNALWGLGNVAVDARQLDKAAASFEAAVAVEQEARSPAKVQEAVAGLTQVALARHDLAGALAQAEAILAYLEEGGSLHDAEEPLGVELVCYRVLQASDDSRAVAVLAAAYGRLQERAARITDETVRRSFLENVPYHRELVAAWAALHAAGSAEPQR